MPPARADDERPPALPAWRRLHAALMPDYNRKATTYWWGVVGLGVAVIGHALWTVLQLPPSAWLQIAAGMAIAMAAGLVPVRIPHSNNSFAAGEIFIFLLLLMFGPAAAVLAAAGEGFVGSYRTSRRWTSRIFSPAMAAVAMGAAGWLLQHLLAWLPENPGLMIIAAMVAALSYFMLVTLLVTAVPRLKANQPLRPADLIGMFGWVGIAYAGSAAVAALLHLVSRESGKSVLLAMVPLLATMLAALHYFFRQQEQSESVRQARLEAEEREKELADRHMLELKASERRFHSAFTHASIGMALLNVDGQVRQVNDALRELLGHGDEALLDRPFQALLWAEDLPSFERQLQAVHGEGFDGFALELRCRHSDGHAVWVSAHCAFFSEPGDKAPSLILQVQDISGRRTAEAELQHIAFHDSLTGLPNRRRFHELLGQAVARAQAPADGEPPEAYAVMFLDFDRFKLINDSLGHNVGDEFLVQVARRIHDNLRGHDIVARLGGDEFAVLVRKLEHERCAVGLAERLMETLKRPFTVCGHEINTSASIGITFSAFGYASAEEVLRDADTAMYKAKNAGKARYALFDASLHTEVANRLRLEGDLRRAIDAGQLSVVYQPQYRLDDGRLSGFEALVRWQHPEDGTIGPADFLPIAEEAGLMLRLTDYVLHCACHQLRAWQESDPALALLTMSVNVSGHDLAHATLVARVTRALVESGLQPQQLTLELNEDILMKRLADALPVLQELRKLGVELAVDDFGIGHSPLSKLSTLPVSILKIDRSFIDKLDQPEGGPAAEAVVRAILLLGHSLGKTIFAEGIETEAQCRQLRSLGCEFGQGYHLARPLKVEQIGAVLDEAVNSAARRLTTMPAPLGDGDSRHMLLH